MDVIATALSATKTLIHRSVWDNAQKLQDLLKKIPMNRLGEPDEIARIIVLLASDFASYITGHTIRSLWPSHKLAWSDIAIHLLSY